MLACLMGLNIWIQTSLYAHRFICCRLRRKSHNALSGKHARWLIRVCLVKRILSAKGLTLSRLQQSTVDSGVTDGLPCVVQDSKMYGGQYGGGMGLGGGMGGGMGGMGMGGGMGMSTGGAGGMG